MISDETTLNRKIFMVISRFPPVIGGAERQCLNLSVLLTTKKYSITVLTERMPGLPKEEILKGVLVKRLPAFPYSVRFLANTSFFIALFLYFAKNHNNVSVIHSHVATASAFFGSLLGTLFGKVTLVKFTGSGVTGEVTTSSSSLLGKAKLKILNLLTDRIVCTDSKIKEELGSIGYPPEKIQVIPNGVDTTVYTPKPHEKTVKTTVLFVGRLELVKNVTTLLHAWQKAFRTSDDVLLIAGDGTLSDKLQGLCKSLHIENSVQFLGKVNDTRDLFQRSDIFVLPSYAEGISNSLIEAMSCGLPVIASKVGGTPGIIEDTVNGLLFDPYNPEELAEKLTGLLANKSIQSALGNKARETIVARYSLEKIATEYNKLYEALLKA